MMILPFKKAVAPGWRPDELAECFRVVDLLIRAGLPVSIETGVSDEGEPWGVVVRNDTGDMLVHLARTDGHFIVASAAGTSVQRGRNLRELINAAFSQGDLALASQRAQLGEGDVLRLHPSALMAAVIVTAWLHTEAGRDISVASRADRSEAGGGGTGAVRLGSDAAHTPHLTVLMKAAVSFAAVVAALETSSNDWMALELDIDALVTLAAAPRLLLEGNSLSYAGMETDAGTRALVNFDALETITADVPAHVPFSSQTSTEVASADTIALAFLATDPGGIIFSNVMSPPSAASVGTPWSTAGLDLPVLTLAERNVAFIFPSADRHGELFAVAPPSGATAPSLNHVEPQNLAPTLLSAPARAPVPVSQATAVSASVPADAADLAISAIRQTASAEAFVLPAARAENAHLPEIKPLAGLEASPFFRTALQFLHLDPFIQTDARPVGAGNFLSHSNATAITGSDVFKHSLLQGTTNTSPTAASPPKSPEETQSNTTTTTTAGVTSDPAPLLNPSSTQAEAIASAAVLSKALPSAPLLDQPVISTPLPAVAVSLAVATVPPERTVPSNTQLLLNFTGDATDVTKASAEAWAAVVAAAHDTAGASRVLVFDASWLSGKAFMLMPGIAMVENDLFADAARVALPPAAPVTLELGDGLSVQLLGILTV